MCLHMHILSLLLTPSSSTEFMEELLDIFGWDGDQAANAHVKKVEDELRSADEEVRKEAQVDDTQTVKEQKIAAENEEEMAMKKGDTQMIGWGQHNADEDGQSERSPEAEGERGGEEGGSRKTQGGGRAMVSLTSRDCDEVVGVEGSAGMKARDLEVTDTDDNKAAKNAPSPRLWCRTNGDGGFVRCIQDTAAEKGDAHDENVQDDATDNSIIESCTSVKEPCVSAKEPTICGEKSQSLQRDIDVSDSAHAKKVRYGAPATATTITTATVTAKTSKDGLAQKALPPIDIGGGWKEYCGNQI